VVCRISDEPMRLLDPGFADVLVGCEAAQGLEPPGQVVGIQEQLQVMEELVVAVVVVVPDRRVLDGSVHPLGLPIGLARDAGPWVHR
jgi:hypothetical protein